MTTRIASDNLSNSVVTAGGSVTCSGGNVFVKFISSGCITF